MDTFVPTLKDPKTFYEKQAQSETLTYEPVKDPGSWQGPIVSY